MARGTHPPKELMDLGIRISNWTRPPGETRTLREIAAICNATIEDFSGKKSRVSWQAISQIELKALRKLHIKFAYQKDPVLRDAMDEMIRLSSR